MDYIQEELWRQRTALAGLLLGGLAAGDGDGEGTAPAGPPPGKFAAGDKDRGEAARTEAAMGVAAAWERTRRPAGEIYADLTAEGGAPTDPEELYFRPRAEIFWAPPEDSRLRTAISVLPEAGRRGGEAAHPETFIPHGLAGTGRPAAESVHVEGEEPAAGMIRERTTTEFFRVEGGGSGAGAEALSRVFQRDARRYDGGFSLY